MYPMSKKGSHFMPAAGWLGLPVHLKLAFPMLLRQGLNQVSEKTAEKCVERSRASNVVHVRPGKYSEFLAFSFPKKAITKLISGGL